MRTEEIVKLTHKRVIGLLDARRRAEREANGELELPHPERRVHSRWTFKSPVEFWPAGGDGSHGKHGICMNLSETGLGLSCDEHLEPETHLEIAVHLPEATLCGQAVVKYCAKVRHQYVVGLVFEF